MSHGIKTVGHIVISPDEWEDMGEQPRNRLLATIEINGVLFHLEAWRICKGEDECNTRVIARPGQPPVAFDDAMHVTEQHDYVLIASPHCE